MSELKISAGSRDFYQRLLSTVSAITLVVAVANSKEADAAADDSGTPTVWIDLGGQLESLSGGQNSLIPSFSSAIMIPAQKSALDVQAPIHHAFGTEGKLTIEPEGSNWVFSASIRYGRSQATRHRHQQTANSYVPKYNFTTYGFHLGGFSYYPNGHVKFADGTAKLNESHAILDFQVGRDVGLGLFGRGSSSVVSAGLRFAQFVSRSNISLSAEPDVQYRTAPIASLAGFVDWLSPHMRFHDYSAAETASRSFHGVGPEIAWNVSAPISGGGDHGEFNLDFGVNGSVLFGRQKVRGHHETKIKSYYLTRLGVGNGSRNMHFIGPCQQYGGPGPGHNYTSGACAHHTVYAPFSRSKEVVVPNVGAFAGLSFRYAQAKVSFGYRADFFFGAMDEGIDVRKSDAVGFHGPFATISVGLGG